MSHLLGVASIVIEHGATEDEAIAALLHDAVEDAKGNAAGVRVEIRRRFGSLRYSRSWTAARTRISEPKPPWRARKEKYIEHLPEASPSIRLVSVSDKLYNARAILADYRDIGEVLWGRFNGGRAGTLWYYRALANAFLQLGPERLAKELDRVVTELEHLTAGREVAT